MNKALILISVFLLLYSCHKDEETNSGPTVVLDQGLVEENITGSWLGPFKGNSGITTSLEVMVEELILGEKVGTGRYFGESWACDVEWTYERFSNGRVIFREKTLDPNICFDNVEIFVRFQDDDFNTLHVSFTDPAGSYTGVLTRQ